MYNLPSLKVLYESNVASTRLLHQPGNNMCCRPHFLDYSTHISTMLMPSRKTNDLLHIFFFILLFLILPFDKVFDYREIKRKSEKECLFVGKAHSTRFQCALRVYKFAVHVDI